MIGVIISLVLAMICGITMANGVEYMSKNHPDYKGEDFLNEEK